jgi:hypothetical protein
MGIGAVSLGHPALATITDGEKGCVEAFSNEIKKFSKVNPEELKPESRCAASDGAENNKAPDPSLRKKLKLSQGSENGTSFPGACHYSY